MSAWAWDDEDTATPPYIHIYSDAGAVALPYSSSEEREQYVRFAESICVTSRELATLAWIIHELYNGASWSRLEGERPEINELTDRLGVWKYGDN